MANRSKVVDGERIELTDEEELERGAEELANEKAKDTFAENMIRQIVSREMASPLVRTILSDPADAIAFRVKLEAEHRKDIIP